MVFDVEAKKKKRKTIGEISKFQIQRKKTIRENLTNHLLLSQMTKEKLN